MHIPYLCYCLQVINARIHANLVQHNDSSFLGWDMELLHGFRDIACGYNVDFMLYRSLNDRRMVDVRNKGDNKVKRRNLKFKLCG